MSEIAQANGPQGPLSRVHPQGAAEKSGISKVEALDSARKTLQGVAAVSSLIPVVGQYIKCAADVGTIAIDMLQVTLSCSRIRPDVQYPAGYE